ncbi:hypothetical protein PTSG_00500 [Salpingoeca rosetta]|uniref:CUB domain-containing protein n=1 Tax=Salpingoeca rosetta (strain ATCC 50818 / BSB-021) TaxID=946362 RepID=F2TWM9_SALR5|nr:uncharacterized protein PTSG_00500 [Salpingoeca rosetta]EGD72475.1 hypothetical protein PTSG_00500 [Salpingoeca rosetta]|eukprot:XP_004999044.1 hypothetical protein PTSG_00500 [Salpingoeca rosetta]
MQPQQRTKAVAVVRMMMTAIATLLVLLLLTCTAVNVHGAGPSCLPRTALYVEDTWRVIGSNLDAAEYSAATTCEWHIQGPPSSRIVLHMLNFTTECSYDFVHIYDGGTHQHPRIGSLSGAASPPPIVSSSNEVKTAA